MHFFVPLEVPLGLPDGHVHLTRFTELFNFRLVRAANVDGVDSPNVSPEEFAVVMRFHRVPVALGEVAADWKWLMGVARAAMPPGAVPPSPDVHDHQGPEGLDPFRTVAELVSEIEAASPDSSNFDPALTDAFNWSLDFLRQFERAYAGVTAHWMPLTARQTLPFMVPCIVHDASGEYKASEFIVNEPAITRLVPAQELDENARERLAVVANIQAAGQPFARYSDLVRESWTSLHWSGDTRGAVVSSYTAGELLLNSLLEYLLWDESMDPVEAASLFFRTGLPTRVRSHYASRLRGNWSDARVAGWFDETARLRHRVVHAGYEPSEDDATSAGIRTSGLFEFIRERVTDPHAMSEYPRTVVSIVGIRGVPAAGGWKSRLEAIASSPGERSWLHCWLGWKRVLDNRILELQGFDWPAPDERELGVALVVEDDDSFQWFVHDMRNGRVQEMEPPARGEDEAATIAHARAEGRDGRFALVIPDPPIIDTEREWMPEYRVMPGYEIFHGRPRRLVDSEQHSRAR